MIWKDEIYEKMKDLVQLANLDEAFQTILVSYINEKKDSSMDFGAMCIFHYQAFTKKKEVDASILTIAAAVELLILSFDIIDDLQDGDADYLWSQNPAVAMNAVLAMLFLTNKSLYESQLPHKEKAMELLNRFALRSINGQYLDINNSGQDEESYLELTKSKSGALVALSALMGAVLSTGQIDQRVMEYSTCIGVVQQILNDINDLKKWEKKNDLLNRRFTLPIIYLFAQSAEYTDILKRYYNGTVNEINANYFTEALVESGAIRYALAIKNIYKYKALHVIEEMPYSEENKQFLKMLIE